MRFPPSSVDLAVRGNVGEGRREGGRGMGRGVDGTLFLAKITVCARLWIGARGTCRQVASPCPGSRLLDGSSEEPRAAAALASLFCPPAAVPFFLFFFFLSTSTAVFFPLLFPSVSQPSALHSIVWPRQEAQRKISKAVRFFFFHLLCHVPPRPTFSEEEVEVEEVEEVKEV